MVVAFIIIIISSFIRQTYRHTDRSWPERERACNRYTDPSPPLPPLPSRLQHTKIHCRHKFVSKDGSWALIERKVGRRKGHLPPSLPPPIPLVHMIRSSNMSYCLQQQWFFRKMVAALSPSLPLSLSSRTLMHACVLPESITTTTNKQRWRSRERKKERTKQICKRRPISDPKSPEKQEKYINCTPYPMRAIGWFDIRQPV